MRRRANGKASRTSCYKLCSLALQYPDEELVAARRQLAAAAAELPGGLASQSLQRFFAWFTADAAA